MDKKALADYSLLGKSGLRVAPFCLGGMTFGTDWGWGCDESAARQIFDRYLDAGGNFIDTADMYTNGRSEEMIGRFLKDGGRRDHVVLGTKFSFSAVPGDPNAGGNGRKNIMRAMEASLRRLQTDYLDILWLHAWDGWTPVEEVLYTMDALVQHGKVRYLGLSNVPAWYLARAQTLAQWRGWERVCALQMEYSLVERDIEREHVPAARHLGVGICSWSPLAGGFLTGKYRRNGQRVEGAGRIKSMQEQGHMFAPWFTDKDWSLLGVLQDAARELRRSPAQVALNWVSRQPQVASTIIGATTIGQFGDLLAANEFEIPAEHLKRLDEASRLEAVYPYTFFSPEQRKALAGGVEVRKQVLAR
ncbi:MAG: aldo/keto reductase [Elusimicrobia bacterium]|nr:aldo/keto reductase [Elusimicrobiota bacterium]